MTRNVPLDITVNSFPPFEIPKDFKIVKANSDFVFLRKDNIIMMINAELKLSPICQINLKEIHPK